MHGLILTLITLLMLVAQVCNAVELPTKNMQKYASIVIDAKQLKVLHHHNAMAKRVPASLTKMMTLYVVFDALKTGKLKMTDRIKISQKAAGQAPTRLGVKSGDTITVEEAINALALRSANDVAYAVAEKLGKGDVRKFVKMMNVRAKQIGMHRTHFVNATGLPDKNHNYTTAYDMAKLCIALRKYHGPYYKYFAKTTFKFRGETIRTHNKLLTKRDDMDGVKTGFINASGFNLATSVHNKKTSIVAVVMGGDSAASRDKHMLQLVNKFSKPQFKSVTAQR